MKNKSDVEKIILILKETYPDAKCSLDFSTPFELLISVMLSAQCTDDRVNKTTPSIFSKYNTPSDFANINLKELEELIHPCGFYRNKAKNIISCSRKILQDFDGIVPNNINDLTSLPGVGRKSANVVMLEAFDTPVGIAVDTHAKRISNKIGLSNSEDPLKIEQDLLKIIDKKYYYEDEDFSYDITLIVRKEKLNETEIKEVVSEFDRMNKSVKIRKME